MVVRLFIVEVVECDLNAIHECCVVAIVGATSTRIAPISACEAGQRFGLLVMGDDLGAPDRVEEAIRLENLGVGMIVHHIGYDHRGMFPGPTPLTDLAAIVAATSLPVQAVGGLSIDEAMSCPGLGAPVVVFGAPLAIDGQSFTAASGDLAGVLADACIRVHESAIAY